MASPNGMAIRTKLDFTNDIVVLVGPDEKRFVVHKDFVTKHSTFFKAALNGEFREAKEKTVRLPEAAAETFAIYAQWLYSGEIVLLEPEEIEKDERSERRTRLLFSLYILADQVGNILLQNQTIDQYRVLSKALRLGPTLADVSLAYEHLPEKSKLRKLIQDWYIANVKMEWLEAHMNDMPAQFAREMAIGFGKAMWYGRPTSAHERPKCDYHVHNDEAPKCN